MTSYDVRVSNRCQRCQTSKMIDECQNDAKLTLFSKVFVPNAAAVAVHVVACCVVFYVLIKGYRSSYGVQSILGHMAKFQKRTSRKTERLIEVTLPDRLVKKLKMDQHYIAEEYRKVSVNTFLGTNF